jgi:hypothetical protein
MTRPLTDEEQKVWEEEPDGSPKKSRLLKSMLMTQSDTRPLRADLTGPLFFHFVIATTNAAIPQG